MEAQTQEKSIRELICEAGDKLDEVRREYFQSRATYEQVAAAATKVLELRQQAEAKMGSRFRGRKTQVNAVSIARLIRSN